jgi:hypothetical protein
LELGKYLNSLLKKWSQDIYKDAQAAFDEAIKIYPSSLPAYIGKGKASLKVEDYRSALSHLDHATLIDGKHPEQYLVILIYLITYNGFT